MKSNGSSVYKIEFARSAFRYLERLDQSTQSRIVAALDKLAANPYVETLDVKKMAGRVSENRLRVGKYRVVFSIHDDMLQVYVIDIGSRGDIYKK